MDIRLTATNCSVQTDSGNKKVASWYNDRQTLAAMMKSRLGLASK